MGQGDDYTTGCLLDYSYFKDHYKLIAIDLSKQQALDADPRIIQQINQIEMEIQQCSLLLKKQKNLFWTFTRNRKSFVNIMSFNTKYSLIFISIK